MGDWYDNVVALDVARKKRIAEYHWARTQRRSPNNVADTDYARAVFRSVYRVIEQLPRREDADNPTAA